MLICVTTIEALMKICHKQVFLITQEVKQGDEVLHFITVTGLSKGPLFRKGDIIIYQYEFARNNSSNLEQFLSNSNSAKDELKQIELMLAEANFETFPGIISVSDKVYNGETFTSPAV